MSTTYPYLGTLGAMQQLPGPSGTITANPSRTETIHTLLSGGTAKTQRPNSKRTYTLPYANRPGIGLDDLLLNFYDGVFDVPGSDLVYVHPPVENVLTLDVSQFGLRAIAPIGWAPSSGTVLDVTATVAPPSGIQATATCRWQSPSASATLTPGTVANTANPATDPVVLSDQPITVSLWVNAGTAKTFTLQIVGYTSTGAPSGSVVSAPINVTTSWQRFSVTASVGALGTSVLALPQLVAPTSAPPTNTNVCGAQLEYGLTASNFSRGYGSPRVELISSPGDSRDKWDGYSDHTLVLGEV